MHRGFVPMGVLIASVVLAAAPAGAQEAEPAEGASVPAGAQEASVPATPVPTGPCATPRAALRSFVQAMAADPPSTARAARCFDRSRFQRPAQDAARAATRFGRLLDALGTEILPDDVPNDPAFRNPDGEARYEVLSRDLDGVFLEKRGEEWLLTAGSLDRISELYEDQFPLGLADIVDSLPDWARRGVLGIEVWQLLGVVLLAFIAFLLQKIAVFVVTNHVRKLVGRLNVRWIERAVRQSSRPVGGLAMALVFSIGFPILQFSAGVNRVAFLAIRVLAALSVVWLGLRVVDALADMLAARAEKTETKLDDQLVPLVRKSLKLFIAVIGGIFLLQNLDVDVGSLLAGLGLGGLAFALAAKDTVANLFGSLVVFVDKPFQIGDWVLIGSVEGTVEEIGFRTTRIRTFYNSVVTLPNARLSDSAIDNMGARRYRRYKTTLGLTYDTPPEKVQAFCEGVRGIIHNLPQMRHDFFLVEFSDYGAHALEVLLYCFMETANWADELRLRTNLNLEILRLAAEMKVEFAFPTQTLHVDNLPPAVPATTPEPGTLAEVVRAFGPGGTLGRTGGIDLGVSFDPAPPSPPPAAPGS